MRLPHAVPTSEITQHVRNACFQYAISCGTDDFLGGPAKLRWLADSRESSRGCRCDESSTIAYGWAKMRVEYCSVLKIDDEGSCYPTRGQ